MLAAAHVAFLKAGPELVAAIVQALKTHPQPPYNRPASTSGRTAQALRFEAQDEALTVYGPAHLQTLLTGRGPTRAGGGGDPLHTLLEQWAQDKGIILSRGMTYKQFGYAAARKIHKRGTALYRLGQPSGLLDQVLNPQYVAQLSARIAAGARVSLSTELRTALTS